MFDFKIVYGCNTGDQYLHLVQDLVYFFFVDFEKGNFSSLHSYRLVIIPLTVSIASLSTAR